MVFSKGIVYSSKTSRPRFMRRQPKTAKKVERKLNRMLKGIEYKIIDTVFNSTVSTTASTGCITLCATGDGISERTGRQIRLSSLLVRAHFQMDDTSPDAYNKFRLIIYQWKNAQNSVPGASDILQDVTSNNAVMTSPINYNNSRIIKVLMDKVITLSSAGNEVKAFKKYKRLNIVTRYSGDTAVIGNTSNNQLHYLIVSDSAVVAHPAATVYFRVRFSDY